MSTIKRIDAGSVPVVENSLALFDLPPSVVSYNKTYQKELLPLNFITRDGPYHFRLYSDSSFIDLSRTYIQTSTSIEKKVDDAWVPLADTADDMNTSVIQNYGLSFIKQLKLTLNSVEIYNSTILYPYYAYIETEFFKGYDTKHGLYQAGLYHTDRMKGLSQVDPKSAGFTYRRSRFENGQKCVSFSRLEFDLANQPRLILPNSDLIFSIWSSGDRFLLLAPEYKEAQQAAAEVDPWLRQAAGAAAAVEAANAGGRTPAQIAQAAKAAADGVAPAADAPAEAQTVANGSTYRIKVEDIRIYCTLVDVVQSLQNSLAKQLELTPAKYPIRRIEMRNQYMSEGQTNLTFNCFQAVLPRRVLVFFINNNAFDGAPDLSPFEFKHGNVQSISIESGGVNVPSAPYLLDFSDENSNFARAFWDFHSGIDMENIELSLNRYKNGFCGYAFDLRSFNRDLGDAFELIKNSTTVLKIHLSKPVEDPGLQVLVWGEFDSVITINSDRVISLDGSI
jgi:hypothetical protein